eukprot:399608_1
MRHLEAQLCCKISHTIRVKSDTIKQTNIFINYYFQPNDHGIIKQFFVASVQISLTILLLFEIIETFEESYFDNNLNCVAAWVIMYLVCVLIEPQISSIVNDLAVLNTYFKLGRINTILNVTTNIILAILLPFVTFFVILASESIGDIVLNATAIAFIVELDDDAAIEIDLENWFVTAGLLYEDIFKEHVPGNKLPTKYTVNDTLTKILNTLKLHNTKIEYDDFNKSAKTCHFMKDLCWFLISPISILINPLIEPVIKPFYQYLHDRCCKTKVDTKSRSLSIQQFEAVISNKKQTSALYSPLRSEDSENDTKYQYEDKISKIDPEFCEGVTEMEYNDLLSGLDKTSQAAFKSIGSFRELAGDDGILDSNEFIEIYHHCIDKAVEDVGTLNDEGNIAMYNYAFNDAYNYYTDAITKLDAFKRIATAKRTEFLSVLYYNKGYSLHQRAKQSWISETITNKYGFTYSNYIDARNCLQQSLRESCKMQAVNNLHQRRQLSVLLTISDIDCDLYEFNAAKSEFEMYEKNNMKLFKENRNSIKSNEIIDLAKTNEGTYGIKILHSFREYVYSNKQSESLNYNNYDPVQILTHIAEKGKEKDSILCGKYYFVLSEYYSKQQIDEQQKWDTSDEEIKENDKK